MKLKLLLVALGFAASQALNNIPQAHLKSGGAMDLPVGMGVAYSAVVSVEGVQYRLECVESHSHDFPEKNTACQWPLPKRFDWEPKPEAYRIVQQRVIACQQRAAQYDMYGRVDDTKPPAIFGCWTDEEGGVWFIKK
jgi:hypothetical protein